MKRTSHHPEICEKAAAANEGGANPANDIETGIAYHKSGDLLLAAEIYKNILEKNPDNPDGLHLLGLVERQQGNLPGATSLIKKAIQNSPEIVEYHCSLGNCFRDSGRFDDSLACYQQALEINPEHVEAYNCMGNALGEAGRTNESISCYRKALDLDPGCYQVFNNLGISLQQQNELDEALVCFQKAIAINSDYAVAHFNMGNILREMYRWTEAIACYNKALEHDPFYVKAINNKGSTLKTLGRFQDAIDCYREVLALDPKNADAHNNMGVAFMEQAHPQEAIVAFRRALEIQPENSEAYCNMAFAMRNAGRLSEAIKCLSSALRIDPENHQAYNNLGNAYKEIGQIDDAMDCYRRALEIRPDYADANSNMLFTMNYASGIDQQTIFLESQKWWQRNEIPVLKLNYTHACSCTDKPLKIGYVSPDFRQHAVSNFIIPLLEAHDRNKADVYCYADVNCPDTITERIRNLADHWRPITGMSDNAVAEMIRNDGISILVDLAGHTAGNRLQVFARKPAPLQISWLGYPNTTGLVQMDYRLTDEIADPVGTADALHSEKLLRLPNGFLCYSPSEASPEIRSNNSGNRNEVTFGCFNNLTKLTPQVISVWAKILLAVPQSRLILKNRQLSDKPIRDHFLELFTRQGICADRIQIKGPTPMFYEHLDLYNQVDIGLDPFPYNGTTSTCEALWMGVPVITLGGDRHASRVGTSILTRIGFGELSAADAEEYIANAIALASDRHRLDKLKSDIGTSFRSSPVCDKHSFARDIEKAFSEIWLSWCKAPPGSDHCCDIPGLKMPDSNFKTGHGSPAASATEEKRARIDAQVKAFPFWYHKISLPYGITTPGWAPLNPEAYGIPDRLDGKRVLDVGAWDGYWSFEALRRGAREVLAIDDYSDFLGQLKSSDRRAWDTFDLCRSLLGHSSRVCKRIEMSVYDLNEETHGRFDVIFFFGTLYHLRYPMLALDRLSAVCDGDMFIESAILDDYSPYQGGVGHGYPNNQMVMEFYPEKQYGDNDSNWWVPSLLCLAKMAKAAGFINCRSWKLTKSPESLAHCRGFVHARK